MKKPGVLCIGGSAGSLRPLVELLNDLPADLPVAVLVCQHTREQSASKLPEILARRASFPVSWARDGESLTSGHVFVAPPGSHLFLHDDVVRLGTGPRVNRHRPSVDVLFASAAEAIGSATTAVVLSGVLDDGAVGSAIVALAGGEVFAQDPQTAEFPSMPQAALQAAPGAQTLTADDAGRRLLWESIDRRATSQSPTLPRAEPEDGMPQDVPLDPDAPGTPGFLLPGESSLTRLTCPDCGGGLAQVDLPQVSYFRCHVGHQYSPQSLADAQAETVEQKLWSAVMALEEQAVLEQYLGTVRAPMTSDSDREHHAYSRDLASRSASLRAQLLDWTAAAPPIPNP